MLCDTTLRSLTSYSLLLSGAPKNEVLCRNDVSDFLHGLFRQDEERIYPARSSDLIMSAAFSPIMIVGALVLPPISVGMIEASTTRKASRP